MQTSSSSVTSHPRTEAQRPKRLRAASRSPRVRPRCASPARCSRARSTVAPATSAAREAISATPSTPRTRSRALVVGTGTTMLPAATTDASRSPSDSATSRRPSLTARIAARNAPSYHPDARMSKSANRRCTIAAGNAQSAHRPAPIALHPAHCGGKTASRIDRHVTKGNHDER